ncbi:T-cell surface glycoprotein CD1b-3-like isoform X5 [Mauremys reevesii]|uniref:T-cell surface glycoprotein CD1b-3-like isoform X5 n=1 Tax=Mauremys reevesii TaxID=260615 RepID=UPI0019400E0E|nr:T-cell surface glycoprotein CD1b-3-like isoform X5 [Mauremys reevesii]
MGQRLINLSPHPLCPPLVSCPRPSLPSCPHSVCHPPGAPHRSLPQRQLHGRVGDGPAGRPGDPLPGLQHLRDPLPAALGPADPDPEGVAGPGADPFVTQGSLGCELHPNGTSRRFYDGGVNGEDFISLDVDAGKWVARQGDNVVARYTRDLLNQDKGTVSQLQLLLSMTCIKLNKSFVQHGNESLARQERPVAVVFARAPPAAGTPAPVLLVCRVTGFYPRPVRVAWLQDGEEVVPGGRLNSSGILPNADLTYQLRSSLGVEPGAGHSYACRVQHSSLGGQSLLIPWEQSRPWGPGLAVCITLGVVAIAAVAVVLWRSRRRGYQDVRPGESRP